MKRHRAPNFSTAEITHLLRLIEQYPMLKNKKTDAATIRKKQIAWQQLTAEYNTQKKYAPRTVENLMACYKNHKIRVKKNKMAIKSTVFKTVVKVEENGPDWDQVSSAGSSSHSQNTVESLTNEDKKEDATHKVSNYMGGGSPADPLCNRDQIFQKVYSLIDPSLEGHYTISDGVSEGMKEQQAFVDVSEKVEPIELSIVKSNVTIPEHSITENLELLSVTLDSPKQSTCSLEIPETSSPQENNGPECKRLNMAENNLDHDLYCKKVKGKRRLAAKVTSLAAENIELVQLKKDILKIQLCEAKEKLEHERQLRAMEIDEIRKKNEHSTIIRQLEIENMKKYKPDCLNS